MNEELIKIVKSILSTSKMIDGINLIYEDNHRENFLKMTFDSLENKYDKESLLEVIAYVLENDRDEYLKSLPKTYPYLGVQKTPGAYKLVYFIEPKTGLLLHNDDGFSPHKPGLFKKDWNEQDFVLYDRIWWFANDGVFVPDILNQL